MIQVDSVGGGVAEARRAERAAAQAERAQAQLEYVAMMADIELYDDEEASDERMGGEDSALV